MGKIFKCYSEGDTPQWMLFLDINQIKKISPKTTRDGGSILFIDYYNILTNIIIMSMLLQMNYFHYKIN